MNWGRNLNLLFSLSRSIRDHVGQCVAQIEVRLLLRMLSCNPEVPNAPQPETCASVGMVTELAAADADSQQAVIDRRVAQEAVLVHAYKAVAHQIGGIRTPGPARDP
ncbi:hypothetical protein [Cupriavidus sp. 8B]